MYQSGQNARRNIRHRCHEICFPERAQAALDAGIRHLGENRDTGLLHKLDVLKDSEPVWHFIGTLQTRKVKAIIAHVSYIHSLDRLSLADEIQKRAKKPIDCFVQVNTSLEPSKHGMAKEEVLPFVKNCLDTKTFGSRD